MEYRLPRAPDQSDRLRFKQFAWAAMTEALTGLESASRFLGRDPWSHDTKVSDDVLPPIFANYYRSLGLTDIMAKADYHELVAFKDPATIDPEVTEVLDNLLATIG